MGIELRNLTSMFSKKDKGTKPAEAATPEPEPTPEVIEPVVFPGDEGAAAVTAEPETVEPVVAEGDEQAVIQDAAIIANEQIESLMQKTTPTLTTSEEVQAAKDRSQAAGQRERVREQKEAEEAATVLKTEKAAQAKENQDKMNAAFEEDIIRARFDKRNGSKFSDEHWKIFYESGVSDLVDQLPTLTKKETQAALGFEEDILRARYEKTMENSISDKEWNDFKSDKDLEELTKDLQTLTDEEENEVMGVAGDYLNTKKQSELARLDAEMLGDMNQIIDIAKENEEDIEHTISGLGAKAETDEFTPDVEPTEAPAADLDLDEEDSLKLTEAEAEAMKQLVEFLGGEPQLLEVILAAESQATDEGQEILGRIRQTLEDKAEQDHKLEELQGDLEAVTTGERTDELVLESMGVDPDTIEVGEDGEVDFDGDGIMDFDLDDEPTNTKEWFFSSWFNKDRGKKINIEKTEKRQRKIERSRNNPDYAGTLRAKMHDSMEENDRQKAEEIDNKKKALKEDAKITGVSLGTALVGPLVTFFGGTAGTIFGLGKGVFDIWGGTGSKLMQGIDRMGLGAHDQASVIKGGLKETVGKSLVKGITAASGVQEVQVMMNENGESASPVLISLINQNTEIMRSISSGNLPEAMQTSLIEQWQKNQTKIDSLTA